MAQRVTEDFVRHYKRLVKASDNPSSSSICRALDHDPELLESIRELHRIWLKIEHHRHFSKRRFTIQAHDDFKSALDDYGSRWRRSWDIAADWDAERRGEENFIDYALRTGFLKIADNSSEQSDDEAEASLDRSFDPRRHSASGEIDFGENYLRDEGDAWDGPGPAALSRAAGALRWMRETVGIDFAQIESRWKEFPVIHVPQRISDKYSIDGKDGLFGYLTQVRLAYIVGADRAAIALCRAVTELLVRFHYARDKRDRRGLRELIQSIEDSEGFVFLKRFNLAEKVREANKILHHPRRDDIPQLPHRDPDRGLITDWIRALEEVIDKAPTRGPTDQSL